MLIACSGRRWLPVLALAASLAAQRHNVLVIVADDVGVDKVGVYGIGVDPPPTPNIDALAARGVRFDNAWANPVCSPTRACIMTGRFCFRNGVGSALLYESGVLPLEETTIPEMLDAAHSGYAHAAIGKWHLSDRRNGGNSGPNLAGWSHYAGVLTGVHDYYSWPRVEDGVEATCTKYNTVVCVDDALSWIESVHQPWLCYLAFQASHSPFHVPPRDLYGSPTPRDPVARYKAMVEAMDTEIGRLLDGLGDALANTDIVFIGDNGTPPGIAETPFDPRRAKGTPYQGGVWVPLIIAGPCVEAPGRTVGAMVGAVDLFATVVELCGVDPFVPWVQSDSISLVPYLRDPDQAPLRTWMMAETFRGRAPDGPAVLTIRDDRYKLLQWTWLDAEEFYDLQTDPYEHRDLLPEPMSAEQEAHYFALRRQLYHLRRPAPGFATYGAATCTGSNGVARIAGRGVPMVGGTYTVMLTGGASNRPAVLTVGASDRFGFGVALPFALHDVGGGAGCFLLASDDLVVSTTTDSNGNASATVTIPDAPVLAGGNVFHAWAVADHQAPDNALGVVTSDALRVTLGQR